MKMLSELLNTILKNLKYTDSPVNILINNKIHDIKNIYYEPQIDEYIMELTEGNQNTKQNKNKKKKKKTEKTKNNIREKKTEKTRKKYNKKTHKNKQQNHPPKHYYHYKTIK